MCEITAWAPNFRPGGEFFNRILNSQFFTEWFTLYTIPQLNVFTAFFAITLLPYALVGAMKDVTARKNIKKLLLVSRYFEIITYTISRTIMKKYKKGAPHN